MARIAAPRKSLLWIIALALVALSTLSDQSQSRGPDYRQDPGNPQLIPDPGGPPPGGGDTDGDADELGIYAAPPPSHDRLGSIGQDRSRSGQSEIGPAKIESRLVGELALLWVVETLRRAF